MKKRKIKIRYIIFALLVVSLIYNSRWVRAKKFFGINIMKYKVVQIDNTLSHFKYDGDYTVVLEFKENRLDAFCKTVEKNFGAGMTRTELEKESGFANITYAENVTGMKLEDDAVICVRTVDKKRVILNPFLGIPKSAGVCIVYKPIEDGRYRAWLSYAD